MVHTTFVGTLDVRIFSGYVWYAYPVKSDAPKDFTLLGLAWLPLKNWDDSVKAFGNYSENGVIFLTEEREVPKLPDGWEITACMVPEGFGYYDPELRWKFRHVHTEKRWEFDENRNGERAIYSIFVGVRV